jgi:hypothetical protein
MRTSIPDLEYPGSIDGRRQLARSRRPMPTDLSRYGGGNDPILDIFIDRL